MKLQRPANVPPQPPPPVTPKPGTFTADSELQWKELMDLADSLGEILWQCRTKLKLRVRVKLKGEPRPSEAKAKAINAILNKWLPGWS
jgi:hypothetical protein